MKRKYSPLISLVILTACGSDSSSQLNTTPDSKFQVLSSTNKSETTPIPHSSPSPISRQIPMHPPLTSSDTKPVKPTNHKRFVSYDDIPQVTEQTKIVPGLVEVVFRNDYHLQINRGKHRQSISSVDSETEQKLNAIFAENNLQELSDLMYDLSWEEAQRQHRIASEKIDGELPMRNSIHLYKFPENADVEFISEQLRMLNAVRTAHPVFQMEASASTTSLGNLSQYASGTNPGTGFFTGPESSDWWWFNKQKVFHGWDIYTSDSTPQTTLAIIDTGFDTTSTAKDKPNYISNFGVKNCNGNYYNCVVDFSANAALDDTIPRTSSHGTESATVAASPLSNNEGLAGIAPDAYIVPIKVESTVGSAPLYNLTVDAAAVQKALYEVTTYSNIDAVNISLSAGNNCPYVYVSHAMRAETEYVTSVADKVVVWAAGNNKHNVANCTYDYSPPSYVDYAGGAIIAGASQNDVNTGRVSAWDENPGGSDGRGSNYHSSINNGLVVHMAAAGHNLRQLPNYNPTTGYSYYSIHGAPTSGTSLAAPMITAAAGMMRRIAVKNGGYLSAEKTRNLLISSSDFVRYTAGFTTNSEEKFIGQGLELQPNADMIGMRHLNLFNALVLAKNIHKYDAITRMTNQDDDIYASINGDWVNQQYAVIGFGINSFWGINHLNTGDTMDFFLYNSSYGARSYGYQVYGNTGLKTEIFEGVSGVTGIQNNTAYNTGFYDNFIVSH